MSMIHYETRQGGIPQVWTVPPKDIKMRVPDLVLQSVVFLGIQKKEERRFYSGGTSFLVGIVSEKTQQNFGYLVTAKHVALHLTDATSAMRINKLAGNAEIKLLQGAEWFYHPDDEFADVAVTPLSLPSHTYATRYIPAGMFLTDALAESEAVGIGDEVYMVGLFNFHSGTTQNTPMLRMGSVAMLPQEQIWTTIRQDELGNDVGGESEAYLIEARSIGGLSGSPVFLRPSAKFGSHEHTERGLPIQYAANLDRFYLMGLMHGHWRLAPQDRNRNYQSNADTSDKINMGIAHVVPAKKILEVLHHPVLVARRNAQDLELHRRNAATMDWAGPA